MRNEPTPEQLALAELLEKLKSHYDLSNPRLGDKVGVSKQRIGHYLKREPGGNMPRFVTMSKILNLAHQADISVPPELIHFMSEQDLADAPGLRESLSEYRGESLEGISLRSNQSVWTVEDRSVDQLGFVPDDIVILDPDVEPEHGDVVSVQIIDPDTGGGRTVLRRFVRDPEGDPRYTPAFVVPATSDPDLDDIPRAIGDRVSINGVIIARHWARRVA